MNMRPGHLTAGLLLAAVAAHGLWRVLAPADTEPAVLLRDDAYYYFVWAENLAAGRGPEVSPGIATNGVQILWGLLLVPLVWLGGGDALPQTAPALGLLLHALAGVLLAGAGAYRPAAWGVAALLGLNPFLLREAQNGQETALAVLLLVVLWRLRHARARCFLPVAALLLLARADLLGFALGFGWLRGGCRGVLVTGVAALLPWAMLNLAFGGTVLPQSGTAIPWQCWEAFLATGPSSGDWLRQLWWYLRPVLLGAPWAQTQPVGLAVLVWSAMRGVPLARPLGTLLLLGGLLGMAFGKQDLLVPVLAGGLLGRWPRGPQVGRRTAAALLFGCVALLLLHYPLRLYPRGYYLAPLAVAGALALLRLRRQRGLLLVAFVLTLLLARPQDAVLPQRGMALCGHTLRLVLPTGEPVGSFNSGIVTFHHPGPVFNLDGAVDPDSLRALQARALTELLDRRDVRFLVDGAHQFEPGPGLHRCGRYFHPGFTADADLQEVARFQAAGELPFVLFWRRGRGVPPPLPARARDLGPGPDGTWRVLWPGRSGARLWAEIDGERLDLIDAAGPSAHVLELPRRSSQRLVLRTADRTAPELDLPPL